jgi:hypothetical protein
MPIVRKYREEVRVVQVGKSLQLNCELNNLLHLGLSLQRYSTVHLGKLSKHPQTKFFHPDVVLIGA